MAHVSYKLGSSFEGALAGGGDPASSPLYVFGPFLRLIVVAGVANITFGASVWLVVFTVAMVSAMYRLVMKWVVDGSGGSGLSEEEFGGWAVKVNAGITFVEYTLTFLVSMAALVTFLADRFPPLNGSLLGFEFRAAVAIAASILIGWLVNRGPKMAARAFGPATLGVLGLLWAMIIATIWRRGLHLPNIDLRAFTPEYLHFTFGGYARILALMTGIEVFANLVAAYSGSEAERSRKAFGSLLIIMGSTCATMLIVGPAILDLANPMNPEVSVFTQTMDALLPAPLPYIGTLIGVVVLASAAAASAQGLQNLALGLRFRHYIPPWLGGRNEFDVAHRPVWVEVAIVCACFIVFGTAEETYLAVYAAGVFILLSMTGWAATKRLGREVRAEFHLGRALTLIGAVLAASLCTIATLLIFEERFFEGAWTYFLFLPLLFVIFSVFRNRLGPPMELDDHVGRFLVGQYLLPYQREARPDADTPIQRVLVPLDGSALGEQALPLAQALSKSFNAELFLVSVLAKDRSAQGPTGGAAPEIALYLEQIAGQIGLGGLLTDIAVRSGEVVGEIDVFANDAEADLIVMSTRGRSRVERVLTGSVAHELVRITDTPLLLVRPTDEWTSRSSQFQRLLTCLDGSESAELALRYVRAIARKFGSEIILLSVPETDSEIPSLETYLASVSNALRAQDFLCEHQVTGTGPARTIVETSKDERADLIVMATRGRGGRPGLSNLGSVADDVLHGTSVPVLLVPARRPSTGAEEAAFRESVARPTWTD